MNPATGSQWQRLAVCGQETSDAPELWTPDRRPARAVRVHLERMCQRCPVRRICAAEAVKAETEAGIYAGVWVPQRSAEKSWVAAMQQLAVIAGVDAIDDDQALGVPA